MYIDIFFNNPADLVYPGGLLSGVVVLTVNEPIKAHSISIFIDGRAHNSWDESDFASSTDSNGATTSTSKTKDFRASLVYAKGEAVVWSSTKENNKIQTGQMQFPFQFMLPANCPPSFEGYYGFIRYQVIVQIDRVWNFNKANRKSFTVAPTFDLNLMPQAFQPIRTAFTQNTGMILSRNGKVTVEMLVPKQGFVPGETVVVDVVIDNQSNKAIKRCELRVHQLSKHFASEFGWKEILINDWSQENWSKQFYTQKIQDRKLIAYEQPCDLQPKQKGVLKMAITIPPTVSSFNICPILQVDYFIKVKVSTKSSFNNSVHVDSPILIGTIPLQMSPVMVPLVPSHPTQQQLYPMATAPPLPDKVAPPPKFAPAVEGTSSSNGVVAQIVPPSYEESVYGAATKDTNNSVAFAPRYPYYNNLPSAPPSE